MHYTLTLTGDTKVALMIALSNERERYVNNYEEALRLGNRTGYWMAKIHENDLLMQEVHGLAPKELSQ